MSSTSGTSAPPSAGRNPFMNYFEEFSERTPIITKSTVFLLIICYIVSWFFDADNILGDIPAYTYLRFEVYRIFLSPFFGNSILMLIVILLFFIITASKMENSQGSLRFLFTSFTLSMLTNLTFGVLCFLLYFAGVSVAIYLNCEGFWNIAFALLTVECMLLPDAPRRLLCIPYDIPSKYFPLVLYALFGLLSGYTLDSLLSMGFGYLFATGYLDRLKPTSYYFENLESAGFWHRVSRVRGWVLAATMGHDAYAPVNQVDRDEPTRTTTTSTTAIATPGRARIFGINDLANSSDDKKDGKKDNNAPTSFSGTGHKLSSGSESNAAPMFTSTFFSSPPPAAASNGSSATGTVNREDLAAKRMAALGVANKEAKKGDQSSQSSGSNDISNV